MFQWIRSLFVFNRQAPPREAPKFNELPRKPLSYTVTDTPIYDDSDPKPPKPPTTVQAPPPSSLPILQEFVAIDCETTGLSPDEGDRIVSFGYVLVPESKEPTRLTFGITSLVFNPSRKSHWAARKKHGLSDRYLSFQPDFANHAADLAELIRGKHVVGHNIDFDLKFLEAEFKKSGVEDWRPGSVSCTMRMFSDRYPGERRSLDNTCKVLGIDLSSRGDVHHALVDALLAAQAFAKMSAAWTFNRVDDVPLTYSNERPVPAAKRGRPRKDAEDDAS